jgi:hypothetical protein
MRLIGSLLLILVAACRPEPSPKHAPVITQLPKRSPITPSTQVEAEDIPMAAPAQTVLDAGVTPPLRVMMTPAADREAVVAPPADAGPDAVVQLPPVPDAQIPLDARGPVPEMP